MKCLCDNRSRNNNLEIRKIHSYFVFNQKDLLLISYTCPSVFTKQYLLLAYLFYQTNGFEVISSYLKITVHREFFCLSRHEKFIIEISICKPYGGRSKTMDRSFKASAVLGSAFRTNVKNPLLFMFS